MTDKLAAWGESIFSVMTAAATKHGALNLAQGFPDFPVDPLLEQFVQEAMQTGYNQYARPIGNPLLCQAIQKLIAQNYNYDLDPEIQLTIVPGATYGIYITMQALVNKGDEVIFFEPGYDSYAPAITMAGGVPSPVRCEAPFFEIPWQKLEAAINPSTKMILINHPHNPTATLLSSTDLGKIAELAVKHDLLIVSDEVYEFIRFDQNSHTPAYLVSGLTDRSVTLSSFGKTLHATGWKCGYIIANEKLSRLIRKVNQFASFSTHHPTQVGIAYYLEKLNYTPDISTNYFIRLQYFIALMKDSRFNLLACQGTYFLLLDYTSVSEKSSKEFALQLIREHGIATIPLSAFYSDSYDPKLLRICFAKENNTLEKAAEILCTI